MGLFDGILVPELDDEDLRLIRDRRGRLALSRPSTRPRVLVQANGDLRGISTNATNKAGSSVTANSAKALSPKPSKGILQPSISKKSMEPAQSEWGITEDLLLLELHRDGKSWDYIEGKLDEKGKNMAALKARLDELVKQMEAAPVEGKEQEMGQKDQKEAKSPGKKDKSKKGKQKGEGVGSGCDKESKKSSGILKDSSKKPENDASNDQKLSRKESKDATIVAKEGYVGKHGRGEVRFFNGVPVLYKHSGANAEQLDADTVAMIHKEAAKHDRSKWLIIVSRLFDRTGIRMDPEVARVALENP